MKEGERRHFLAWLPPRRPRDMPVPDSRPPLERILRPAVHLTRQFRLETAVRPGDRIWLVRRWERLAEPSLDASITVQSVTRDEKGLWFAAGEGSRYYGWNDFGQMLRSLDFEGPKGRSRLDDGQPLGQQLQTTRRIESESARRLEAHAAALATRPVLFISYRWSDSATSIGPLISAAAQAGFATWLDRWSGPRRLSEGHERSDEEPLNAMLAGAIDMSSAGILVESPKYEQGKWTKRERALIEASGKPGERIPVESLKDEPALLARLKRLRRRIPGESG